MNLRPLAFVAISVLGAGAAASSQTYTETRVEKPIIVTGEVVRLEPGKTIVIRSGGSEVSYVLTPELAMPADVQVGRTVSLQTVPGAAGVTMVKQVTTTTVTPEGDVKRTTETTRTSPSGDTSRTTVTTISGKVEGYVPGKSVTVIDPKGARITYMLAAESQVPAEVIMGKEVTVYVSKEQPAQTTYEIERDGNTIKIKARTKK